MKRISRKEFILRFRRNGYLDDPFKDDWYFFEEEYRESFDYMFENYNQFGMHYWDVNYVFKKDKKGIWRIYEKN